MRSALVEAVCAGDIDRVRELVQAGADLNYGGTDTHEAVSPADHALKLVLLKLCPLEVLRYLLLRSARYGRFMSPEHVTSCSYDMPPKVGRVVRAVPRLCKWRQAWIADAVARYWLSLTR